MDGKPTPDAWRVLVQIRAEKGPAGRPDQVAEYFCLDAYEGRIEEQGQILTRLHRTLKFCENKNKEEAHEDTDSDAGAV